LLYSFSFSRWDIVEEGVYLPMAIVDACRDSGDAGGGGVQECYGLLGGYGEGYGGGERGVQADHDG